MDWGLRLPAVYLEGPRAMAAYLFNSVETEAILDALWLFIFPLS